MSSAIDQLAELESRVAQKQAEIVLRALTRLEEAYSSWEMVIDPREGWAYSPDPEKWLRAGESESCGIRSEEELAEARSECRYFAEEHPNAIAVHELYESFVIGTGIEYRAAMVDLDAPSEPADLVNEFLSRWMDATDWKARQAECRKRVDRDGEAFIRLYRGERGLLLPRFIEPGEVRAPDGAGKADAWGVRVDPEDVETVLGYWVGGQFVDAESVQHRKRGADRNQRRGVPLLWACRHNLRRVEKTRRNMSVVFAAQAAIAAVRKTQKSKGQLEQMIRAQSVVEVPGRNGSQSNSYTQVKPGTIVDIGPDESFEAYAGKVDVDGGNKIIQAELRAIGSRTGLPEYMISGDASNANFSSTMVAEGPAVRQFRRLQAAQCADDLAVLWRALEYAAEQGEIAFDPEVVTINATPPSLETRDRLQESQRFQIEKTNGVVSIRTWRQQVGYDHDVEEANLNEERDKAAENMPLIAPKVDAGGTGDDTEESGVDDDGSGEP